MSLPTPSARAALLAFTSVLVSACAPHPRGEGPAPAAGERIARIQSGLLTHNVVRGEAAVLTIQDRLRFYRVPGVSVAVIDGGRIHWARGWGEVEAGSGTPVDSTTLFQAASISKPVAAAAALRLVQDGALRLDEDVNLRLRSWKVAENEFTATEKVTLRRLLSHSAGTTIHGFGGYTAGAALPSLLQVLDGAAPANSRAVRVDVVPGSRWRYSGGGTLIAQLLMTDVTGRPFADLARELVLEPAGMRRSTLAQPLPTELLGTAATAHSAEGAPIPGRHHVYPELAAAGLWTTPSDLARLAVELQRAYSGEPGRILSPEMAREMLRVQAGGHGLGFSVDTADGELWFEHGGSNRGFQAYFAANARRGIGAVIMTNGDGGFPLALEILRSIAREYGWPGVTPTERDAIQVDAAVLAQFTGSYYADSTAAAAPVIEVRLDGGVLRATVPRAGLRGRTLRPSAPDTFFFLENPGELTFERDPGGTVTAVVLSGLGNPLRATRR